MSKENKNVAIINNILNIDDSYKAPEKIMKILFDKEEREKIFMEFLEQFNFDVNYDWFNQYFQEEHADRKKKKQDFTPRSVCQLLSEIVQMDDGTKNNGLYYECCAGTGSILINYWDNFRKKFSPFNYEPRFQFAVVEELSDRCIPFLLFNMMLRGMNGVVIHGDCLSRKCKNAYFICNQKNDHLTFSGITVIPHNDFFEKELCVKFETPDYIEHKELMDLDLIQSLLK